MGRIENFLDAALAFYWRIVGLVRMTLRSGLRLCIRRVHHELRPTTLQRTAHRYWRERYSWLHDEKLAMHNDPEEFARIHCYSRP